MAKSPNQRTGRAYVRLAGVLYETMKGAKLSNISGMTREPIEGAEVFGFKESVKTPELDCSFAHGATISTDAIGQMVDVTITFECDSGPTFVLSNAWLSDGPHLDPDNAKVDCKFMAKKVQEQGASS